MSEGGRKRERGSTGGSKERGIHAILHREEIITHKHSLATPSQVGLKEYSKSLIKFWSVHF